MYIYYKNAHCVFYYLGYMTFSGLDIRLPHIAQDFQISEKTDSSDKKASLNVLLSSLF